MTIGSKIRVIKGCEALNIKKEWTATVTSITPLGKDYGHFVAVRFNFPRRGTTTHRLFEHCNPNITLYARHINRLNDAEVNLHNGNPFKKITIREIPFFNT